MPSQPRQPRQAQGPADPAESGHVFQPKSHGLLATEARGLPDQAGLGCKHFLSAGVERGSCPLSPRQFCFQVVVEESGRRGGDAPSLAGHAVQAPAPGSPAAHTGPAVLLGNAALVLSSILQETMFL